MLISYYDYEELTVAQRTINSKGKCRTVSCTFTGKVPLVVHIYLHIHAMRKREWKKKVGWERERGKEEGQCEHEK